MGWSHDVYGCGDTGFLLRQDEHAGTGESGELGGRDQNRGVLE